MTNIFLIISAVLVSIILILRVQSCISERISVEDMVSMVMATFGIIGCTEWYICSIVSGHVTELNDGLFYSIGTLAIVICLYRNIEKTVKGLLDSG